MPPIEVTTPDNRHPQADDILKPRVASKVAGVPMATLAHWRKPECGLDPPLPFVQYGKKIFYRRSDLSWWLRQRAEQVKG